MSRKNYTITYGKLYELLNQKYNFYKINESKYDGAFDRSKMNFGVPLDRPPKDVYEAQTPVNFTDVVDYYKSLEPLMGKAYTGYKLLLVELDDIFGRMEKKYDEVALSERDKQRKLNVQTETKIQRKGQEYIDYARQFAKTEEEKQALAEIEPAMEELSQMLISLNEPGLDGNKQVFTADKLDSLRASYGKLAEKCSKVVDQIDGKPKAFQKSIQNIYNFVSKDLAALETVPVDSEMSFSEAIAHSRDKHVGLDTVNVEIKSGAISQRMPMMIKDKNGKEIKGLFTKNSTYTIRPAVHAMLDRWSKRDKELAEICSRIREQFDALEDNQLDEYFLSDVYCKSKLENDQQVFSQFAGNGPVAEVFKELNNRKDFRQLATEASTLIEGLAVQYEKFGGYLQIPEGANVDKRNSAMSFVADLMGCPKLIARSIPMTVSTYDLQSEGTFMEFVEGTDVNNIQPEDPYLSTTKESFDHCSGFKDLANLGILDYICSNIDRHRGNMFYKFGGKDGKELVGVVGIDNDLSFGTPTEKILDDIGAISNKDNLKFIGVDAAKYVQRMNPATLKAGLKNYGLSDAEIDAACTRLKNVQDAIASGQIKQVSDDEWKNYTLSDMVSQQGGIFKQMEAVATGQELATKCLERKLSQPQKEKSIIPTAESLEKYENLDKLSQKMGDIYKELLENNKGLFVGSKEYDNVLHYAEYAQLRFKDLAEQSKSWDLKNNGVVKSQLYHETQAVLGNLHTLATIYLDYKQNTGTVAKNERSMNRNLAVLSVKDLCENNLNKYTTPDDQAYKLVSADARKAMYKTMKPKQIAGVITQLTKLKKGFGNAEAINALSKKINDYTSLLKDKAAEKQTDAPKLQSADPQLVF